jgi:hypothetical protein
LECKLKELIKKDKLPKSKTSPKRKDAIVSFLEKDSSYGYGFFAHYLVKMSATMRIAFAPGKTLVPAVLVLTERKPLFHCLGSPNDDEGDAPLCGPARQFDWCKKAGTQFALQDVNLEIEDERDIKSRIPAKELKPDAKLRAQLLSKKPVVYLDVIASLAPRAMAKDDGHSTIVKAELAKLMKEAKQRGEWVVFALGSDAPHTLFKKVYNRPPIADYGLRCGYLRWRASASDPWEKEAPFDMRTCICFQSP